MFTTIYIKGKGRNRKFHARQSNINRDIQNIDRICSMCIHSQDVLSYQIGEKIASSVAQYAEYFIIEPRLSLPRKRFLSTTAATAAATWFHCSDRWWEGEGYRESFFYPCSPKNLPKETPFLRPTTFKLFPPSPSLSPQKEPLFDARKSRANIRDGFSPVKSASRFFFSPRSRALLSFFQSGTLQVFLLSLPFSPHLLPRPPVFQSSAMNLPLSLVPFLQALFTCFRPGYKCPRVSGLQVVSATRNHCPLAVRFRGGRGGLSRGAACGE